MTPELKRLYDLGLALHWLHPKSKAPIGSGWTTGPRKTWEALTRSHRKGMNVGVRLGSPSKVGPGYLAVIDCDVKSSEKKHRLEMGEKLKKLFPQLANGLVPQVITGRGNGSTHLYVLTREPAKPARRAQSADRVKALMPSAGRCSKYETEHLTGDEISRGVRIRPAWEISLMGEGQQVVLPPSVHPDTGELYRWGVPLGGQAKLCFLKVAGELGTRSLQTDRVKGATPDWAPVPVDLVTSALSDADYRLITQGEGCEGDRSVSLYLASLALVKVGFSDPEILTVLTDRDNFLGDVAYAHTQSDSRAKAARWVSKFTLDKARREASTDEAFKSQVEEMPLGEEQAAAQAAELEAATDWKLLLDRTEKGAIKSSLLNLQAIFKNAIGESLFKRNLFSSSNEYGCRPPWNGALVGDEVRDDDITNIMHWLACEWGFEAADRKIHQAINELATKNAYHPVRDYLATLEWDGVPRLDTWLKVYLGAEAPEPYLSAVSRKTLCAMVARVMVPGTKYDQVLILEGLQGTRKSTTVRVLARPWFSDAAINVNDKDAVVAMRSVWVLEMGELSSMNRADVNQLKEFVSRATDRIRMPYGRLAENIHRQCIFIGTTNSDEYLKDTTGNRRFWPVKVGECDTDALARDRDQLMAEAVFAWELGEPLYLDTLEQRRGASEETEHRVAKDDWEAIIGEFLDKGDERFNGAGFLVSDLFTDWGALPREVCHTSNQMRAAGILKRLGYEKSRKMEKGERKVLWVRKGGRCHTSATPLPH